MVLLSVGDRTTWHIHRHTISLKATHSEILKVPRIDQPYHPYAGLQVFL